MRLSLLRCILFISLIFPGDQLRSQDIPDSFSVLTDSLIAAAPQTYQGINTPLRPFRRDTVLMAHFIKSCQNSGYWDGLAYAYNQMGTRYRNISEYPRAIEYHNMALEASDEADNLEFRIFSLNMLGVVYRRMDAIKTALDYSQQALELGERIENPSVGIKRSINVSLNSIGNIYQALEQYDRAIEHFERSLLLETELGNTRGMAVNLQNKGECLEAKGLLNEALDSYQRSLVYDAEIGSLSGQAICHNSIGRVYIKQGQYSQALPLLEMAYAEAEETKDQQIICPTLINLGWAQMELGLYARAEPFLQSGLQIAQEHNFLTDASRCCSLLSELKSREGDYQTALDYYKQADSYSRQITNDINIKYVNDVILRYDFDKQQNQIELLNQQNEIVKLKLRRNKTTLLVGALLLVMFTLILYIIYRQYQLKSDKKMITLEQSMLRSQMNPHFLFNSLNSIKHYIINNEQKNAVTYLNKFSKLVRKILEASSMKEIPLADELETVELYMNIENIRFNNEIEFKLEIDPEINPGIVKIPSLILQPFLENALWHGLASKEGAKRIHLRVSSPESGYILLQIRDNGIGRVAAEQLKQRKVLKRKSVGIAITKERLANFAKDYQHDFDLSIEDLHGEDGSPAGTEVRIKVPTV